MDSINITLSNKVFIDSIKIAKTFNTEGHISFNQEGILIQNIDSANVSFNSILIKKSGLQKFLIKEDIKIFLNFESLFNIIKNNKKENINLQVLDSEDYKDKRPDKLYLNLDSFKSELTLLNPEYYSSFKPIPSLEHNISFKMDSSKLKEVIKNLKGISDKTIFKYNQDSSGSQEGQNKRFMLYSINNINTKMEYNITIKDIEGRYCNDSKEEKSSFSNEYLNKYISNLITPEVSIFLSSEYPLYLLQEDSNIQYKFILAPRIEEDS